MDVIATGSCDVIGVCGIILGGCGGFDDDGMDVTGG
jgi:hypothetical protein